MAKSPQASEVKGWTRLAQIFSEHAWLSFLAIGFILTLLGAPGALRHWNIDVIDAYSRTVLLAFGLLLIACSFFMKLRDQSRQSLTVRPNEAATPDQYEGQIAEARRDEQFVYVKGTVKGTIRKNVPDGVELWLLSTGTPQGHREYWPQGKVQMPKGGSSPAAGTKAAAEARSLAADHAAHAVAAEIDAAREELGERSSLHAIARALIKRAVPTPRRGTWTATAVHRVLARVGS
jgi:hypothetical protein